MITSFVEAVVLPPGGPLLLATAGLALRRPCPRAGRALVAIALLALYLLSTPLVSNALTGALQPAASLSPAAARAAGADAIVLLAGGLYNGPEYGGDSVGPASLVRTRFAALLARETGLPVLVSGGVVNHSSGGRVPEAALIARLLIDEFGVDAGAVGVEARSQNTLQNARYSAPLLRAAGRARVLLVTHAIHMPRALAAFRAAGIDAVAAPTAFFPARPLYAPIALKPAMAVLGRSHYVLYEGLARLWYRLRYGLR